MKGNPQVLGHLDEVLRNELTTINQTFLHARMLGYWGIERLGERIYRRSIRAMKDADDVIERILFLEGLPNLQHLGKLLTGEHTHEILQCELKAEMAALATLRAAVACCEAERDYVSRDELTEIVENREEYVDWLEAQLYQVDKMGIRNYVQLMTAEGED